MMHMVGALVAKVNLQTNYKNNTRAQDQIQSAKQNAMPLT